MKCLNPVPLKVNVKKDKNISSLPTIEWERFHLYATDPIGFTIAELNTKSANLLAPCGKCYACRQNRVKEWTLRLAHEYHTNFADKQMFFLTLTYDNEHIGDPSLDYNDFQLFMKRLRKFYKADVIKYMVVGEYGFKSYRKHFHCIIFGMSKVNANDIHNLWKNGFVNVKKADINACHYLLKYSFKQHFINKNDYIYLGLTPPMFRASKGFGKSFLLKYGNEVFNKPFFEFQKKKYAFPRYYRNFFYKCNLLDGWEHLDTQAENTRLYILDTMDKAGVNLGYDNIEFDNIAEYHFFKKQCKIYLDNTNNLLYQKFISNFQEAI